MKWLPSFAIACSFCIGLPFARAQATIPRDQTRLLETVRLVGDWQEGFRKDCLLVLSDGQYHHEHRRQVSKDGQAQYDWEPPEVFEGKLNEKDFQAIHDIMDNPGFSSITGTIGDESPLISKLSIGPEGAVVPHDDIDILVAIFARSKAAQLFEIVNAPVPAGQKALREFVNWAKEIERQPAKRFASSQANNCSSLIDLRAQQPADAQTAVGLTFPQVLHAVDAQMPQNVPNLSSVTVDVWINPDGTVGKIRFAGHPAPELKQTVQAAVSNWTFAPGRLLGVPIPMRLEIQVKFHKK